MKENIEILLVDDHQVVRDGLQRMLEQEEDLSIVGQGADSEETFEQIDKLSPDVVLLDIKMPGMDGIELTRQVKQRHPSCNIIMLTLYDQYLTQAMEAGANGYLLKDIKAQELAQAIRDVHNGKVVTSESLKSSTEPSCESRQEKKTEYRSRNMVEEVQIVLPPPVEAGQLMRLSGRVENSLDSRVLQMIGGWQEGTVMTVILNNIMTLEEILDTFEIMPEVIEVGEEPPSESVKSKLLKKANSVPRAKNRARKTIFVSLKKN